MKKIHLVPTLAALMVTLGFAPGALAQDRLKTMPGYERYQRLSKEIPGAVKLGALAVTWQDGGQALEYQRNGKRYRYDLAARTESLITNPPAAATSSVLSNSPAIASTNAAATGTNATVTSTNAPSTQRRSRRAGRDRIFSRRPFKHRLG